MVEALIEAAAPVSPQELHRLFTAKYGPDDRLGWGPKLRREQGYFTPDDHYEALVDRLVKPGSSWLDVGCGRELFPSHKGLAKELSVRAGLLVGVDPDVTLLENPYVHRKVRVSFDEYRGDQQFDLLTLRMVAEHVVEPERLVASVAHATKPGGLCVVYTVYRWSPMPLLTQLVPMFVRHPIKKFLWRTEEKDTFPTAFKMNTRGRLKALFDAGGFDEASFELIDDCRTLARFKATLWLETSLRKLCRAFGFGYPERCVLAAYRKRKSPESDGAALGRAESAAKA